MFRNTAIAAGIFALALCVPLIASGAFGAAQAAPGQGLEDVQVGEKDLQTRIALICDGPCSLEKRGDGVFFLRGVTAEMSLDLSTRSHNIAGFTMVPDAEGSLLNVASRRILEYANTKSCVISGRSATCVDLFYADAVAQQAALSTPSLASKAEVNPAPARVAPKPTLRESAPDRLSRFAALAPPERLAPPQPARLASVQPVQKPVETARPVIREERPLPAPAPQKFDYAAQVEGLLGKKLTPGYCASARATLQSDPWALGAMVDVGLCEAAAGKSETADATLARILEYTPDNYEAYVGRALIALEAGEKSVARRYFQNALDAPPPMEESTRIVAAMREL
ncbi:tetratricopeptide repeat protein [Hyphococcus sp.]|uniref:tetratricopeptide repeat protein n=1 Tax=Hyphococcus sp. TaxID=2038636 RepID=UPI0035C726CF